MESNTVLVVLLWSGPTVIRSGCSMDTSTVRMALP